jgi:glycosyltransferase involved in cell wall biosynthesis
MKEYSVFVSVIVPVYKDWDRLRLCLDSLANQDYPKEKFEIILVDNDSQPNLPADLRLPENCKYKHEPKTGSYAARNSGLDLAEGEIIGFTDSDCITSKDWITKAVEILLSDTEIKRVTGPVKLYRLSDSSYWAWKLETVSAFTQKHNVQLGVSVTANLFVKSEVFGKIGNFDSALFSGGDFEWNKRAQESNLKLVYSDDVCVLHPARKTMSDILVMYRRTFGGRFARAKASDNLFKYYSSLFLPPVNSLGVWVKEQHSPLDIFMAFVMLWVIKILMLPEIIRLHMGGQPQR